MSVLRIVGGCIPVVLLVLAGGCSDAYDGRMAVSGTVKLKGQPIKDGAMVEFDPLEKQGTRFTSMTGGGAFKVPRENGLKPGKYLVRVTVGDGKTPVNPVDPNAPPGPTGNTNIVSKDLVPKDWNVNSKQERTVTAEGPNAFDFDIP